MSDFTTKISKTLLQRHPSGDPGFKPCCGLASTVTAVVVLLQPFTGWSASHPQNTTDAGLRLPAVESQVAKNDLAEAEVDRLITELASPDFAIRQAAIRSLQRVSESQISMIATAAQNSQQLEVAQRIVQLLEQFYQGDDQHKVVAASEALETAAISDRWALAEAASDVLDRHWIRRFELTQRELRSYGIFFNRFNLQSLAPGRFGRANFIFPGQLLDSSMLQINLDSGWKGGERGMQLLARLATLAGPSGQVGAARVGVYLIDGHTVSEQDISQLKILFGDSRVVSRGKVCLGITNDPTSSDTTGCRVADVKPGTSAHKGGIRSEDLIVAVDDQRIRDFDHLVDMLKKFEIGDVVKMEVLRGGSIYQRFDVPRQPLDVPPADEDAPDNPYRTKRMVLDVRLLGWKVTSDEQPNEPSEQLQDPLPPQPVPADVPLPMPAVPADDR